MRARRGTTYDPHGQIGSHQTMAVIHAARACSLTVLQ